MRKRATAIFSVALIVVLSACDNGSPTAPSKPVEVPSAAVNTDRDAAQALDQLIEFKTDKSGVQYLTSGWMATEIWGTWTATPTDPGVVTIPVDRSTPPVAFSIEFWGQLGPPKPTAEFTLQVDGDPPVTLRTSLERPIVTEVIPLGTSAQNAIKQSGNLVFRVMAPDARSPKSLGINTDERLLGFGIRQMTLLSDLQAAPPPPVPPPAAAEPTSAN